ncbi:MAG: NADH-quinone oxidoreductase subunit M [Rectinemataceae bacterium]|jgi:NADH-quinone oxidoreductase subunit M
MILVLFIAMPLVCGLAAWALGMRSVVASRVATLAGSLACLALAGAFWIGGAPLTRLELPWIPSIGASFSLSLDGLSLPFLALSGLLGIVAVIASWKGIEERVPFFHFNLSLVLAGVNGVFLASDLFLFAFMWELMLVPMFFVIDIWGHEGRHRAAIKFLIFTQAGGLLMIAAIAGLYAAHGSQTGEWSFAYDRLRGGAGALSPTLQFVLMLGFFAGFAVKLPAFGLHAWLPDAHTEAPTAGSILLAGILLKTGGYGLLRFALPLFPEASRAFAPIAMWIGAAGILYGGIMALGQSDMKRLVAYSSVSHLGFVLVGIYSMQASGRNGAVIQMLSHGLSTGALFMLVGALQDRIGTRELGRMGGLAHAAPRMGALGLALTLALLGLPGMGNFVGELLVLFGAFKSIAAVAVVSGLGLVIAMAYALRMFQLAFHGEAKEKRVIADLSGVETASLGFLLAILLWIGLYPRGVLAILSLALPGMTGGIAP